MEELVTIVDENDCEIGVAPRSEMRAKRLIHRASYILVFNANKELFVQKRTMTKDVYPGYYDIAAGGVVVAGEGYEESAQRELFEELGIKDVELVLHFKNFYEDTINRVWGKVFSCTYDGDIALQKEEVELGFFAPISEIVKMTMAERFTPDSMEILQKFVQKYNISVDFLR